jgi:hypothetical protein
MAGAAMTAAPSLEGELVDQIRRIVVSLVNERQQMSSAVDAIELEANRLAIVYWQEELTRLGANPRRLSADSAPKG